MGRPTEYTIEVATEICERLVSGQSLLAICRAGGMPTVKTVYAWRAADSTFDHLLTAARGDQADTFFYEAIETSRRPASDAVAVQRHRLIVDTLKWAAGRLKPKVYGDKVAVGGADDLPPINADIDCFEGARRIAFALARGAHAAERLQRTGAHAAPPPSPSGATP